MQGSSSQDGSTTAAVIISNSVFTGNYGADFGGAIYMESVGVELRDVLLDSNACAPVRGLGGGLASEPLSLDQPRRFLRPCLEWTSSPPMPALSDTSHECSSRC